MIKDLKRKMFSMYTQYSRVWRLLRRPTAQEFKTISKISSIGLLVIGLLGFLISIVITSFFY